jgi:hypothetical protein
LSTDDAVEQEETIGTTGGCAIGRQDVQQWVAEKFRQRQGWQTVRNSWVLL